MPGGWRTNYVRYRDFFLNVLRQYKARPDIKSYLEIILSLTAILIFSLFAIKPTILTIIDLNREIADKEDISSRLTQKVQNLRTAANVLAQETESISYVNQSVPDTAEVDEAVGQIQGFASQNGVEILSVSSSDILLYGKEERDKKGSKIDRLPQSAGEVPITISVTGQYQNLFSFLKDIENLRRPIKVDSFAINSSITNEGMILVMLISGRMPYINE